MRLLVSATIGHMAVIYAPQSPLLTEGKQDSA